MADDKGTPGDGPSLEMPSLPFGRRKRRAAAEADAPTTDSPAVAPSPADRSRPSVEAQAPSATAPPVAKAQPAQPLQTAEPVPPAPPAAKAGPVQPVAKAQPAQPAPAVPTAEPSPPAQETQPASPAHPAPRAEPPVQKSEPVRPAPATPPAARPVQETRPVPPTTPVRLGPETGTMRPAAGPGPVTPLDGDPDADGSRPRRTPALPALGGVAAALATGAAIGGLGVLLVWLAARGCEAARGTASCGDGPGFLVLLAILAVLAYLGGILLRAFGVPDAGSTSLLAVGVMAVLLLVFFTDSIFSWWMVIVVPLVAALAYALSWWVTTRVVQNDDEPAPTRL